MKNTEWYYKKVLNKIGEFKLRRKVMRDVFVFILCIILTFSGMLILLFSIFRGLYFEIDIVKETNYFVGLAISFSASIILIFNDNRNPLNKLIMNDKIFCWIHYLTKQIKLYESNKWYNLFQKIKFRFIVKIINKDLYSISNNLDNSFVFLKNKEKTIHKVEKLIKLLNMYIIDHIDRRKVIEKSIGLLHNIEKQYMLLVSNKMLYSETDINMTNTSKELEELFNEKYDELFDDLEVIMSNDAVALKSVRNIHFLKGKSKYFILCIWIIAGTSLIYLIFKDESLATLIGSVVGVFVALFGGIRFIMKDKGD